MVNEVGTTDEAGEAVLPRALAVAWGMYEAPQRGPKRELSHERIVEAAIELADRDGLAAVTMAKVAEALGFTTMSLYRYVTGKDELLALMQDEAGRLEGVVEDEDWEQGLRDLAEMLLASLRRHPWLTEMPVSRQALLMPNSLAVANQAMRAMRTLPLGPLDKQAVLLLVVMVVRGYAALERDLEREPHPFSNPTVAELLSSVVTSERFGDLADMMTTGQYPAADDGGDDTAWAIDRVLAGIRHRVDTTPAPAEATATELTPEEELGVAEAELEAVRDLRKQAQQRVKDLEKRVAAATKQRDRAKERARNAR